MISPETFNKTELLQSSSYLKKNKKKCGLCKKKYLITKECICGMIFCISHIQPEKHFCEYDFTQDKNMQEKICFMKIDKI